MHLRRFLRLPARRERIEGELDIELAFHFDMKIADLIARGLTPSQAREEALRRFGDVVRHKRDIVQIDRRQVDQARRAAHLESAWQDLRYAVRGLVGRPLFSSVILLTLALGIGANTAIFTLVNALMLRELPVRAPNELVNLQVREEGEVREGLSAPAYVAFRDAQQAFSGLAAHSQMRMVVSHAGSAERVMGDLVSGNYFGVLAVRPVVGRAIVPTDDGGSEPPRVIVLGYGAWQRLFGGDRRAVGSSVQLNGNPYTVIGVAPASFTGTLPGTPSDLWIPLAAYADVVPAFFKNAVTRPGLGWLDVIGRLRPGVSMSQAEASLRTLAVPSQDSKVQPVEVVLTSAARGDGPTLDRLAQRARILMAVVALVLVIVCANIAVLLHARAASREREIAVRMALGAGRGRLARQLLIESLLLGVLGGALGLIIASWTKGLLGTLAPGYTISLPLDGRVLAFTAVVSTLTALVFGTLPAVAATRPDLIPALRGSKGTRGAARAFALRDMLVVAQVSVSLVLLVAGALFVRTLRALESVDLGLTREHVVTAGFDLNHYGYDAKRGLIFQQQLLEGVRALPGVRAAAVALAVPPGEGGMYSSLNVEGLTLPENEHVAVNLVSPDYFKTMGIRVVRGREFTDADREGAPEVVIVNESFVRRYLPNGNPVGKRVGLGGPLATLVGVARDGKYESLRDSAVPMYYAPISQFSSTRVRLVVRGDAQTAAQVAAIRSVVRSVDPRVALYDVATLEERIDRVVAPERATATLSGTFASLALLLAALGLFGVMSYRVTLRTREIGIRVALGAGARDLLRGVVGRALGLAAIGVSIGIVGALAMARAIQSVLYGVSTADPLTYTTVPLLLLLVAGLASYLPARRATKVDPMIALRAE